MIVSLPFHMILDTSLALTWHVANENNATTLGQKNTYIFVGLQLFRVLNNPIDSYDI